MWSRNRSNFVYLCCSALGCALVYFLLYADNGRLLHSEPKYIHERITDPLKPSLSRKQEFLEETVWWRKLLCDKVPDQLEDNTENFIVLQHLYRDIKPKTSDSNVFLLDTKCNSKTLFRAWCSVESWARQNPKMKVWYVLTSETADDTDGLPSRLLQRYKNLQVVGADLDRIFAGTPAKEFFLSGNWMKNKAWVTNHLSDMLRVAVVWHWGGFYSDTDIICLKDMTNFRNAIGFESESFINNAIFHMKDHTEYLRMILEEMQESFKPFLWTSIGGTLYTKLMERECEAENITLKYQKEPLICRNITVYPMEMFYPISPDNYGQYFKREAGKYFSEDFKNSSLLHLWNKLSHDYPLRVQSESIYEVAANTLCPLTYKYAVRRSKFF